MLLLTLPIILGWVHHFASTLRGSNVGNDFQILVNWATNVLPNYINQFRTYLAYIDYFIPFSFIKPLLIGTFLFWILRIVFALINWVKGII